MAGFKGQANAATDFKMKTSSIYRSRNPAKSTPPVLYKSNNKAWMTAFLFTICFTKYFKPTTIANSWSEEKTIFSFKILPLTGNAPCHPGSLMKMYNEIKVVYIPVNTTSFL